MSEEPLYRSNDRGRLEALAADLNADLERQGQALRWEVGKDNLGTAWQWTLYPVGEFRRQGSWSAAPVERARVIGEMQWPGGER